MKRRESFGPADLANQNRSTSNLISGGASADYDTLKEIEDKLKIIEAGGIVTDKTLSKEDAAADAKAVGDKIKDIEENGIAKINDVNVVGELDSVDDLKIAGKVITYDSGNIGEIFNDYENNDAYGIYSHAEGINTCAKGDYSHSEGFETYAAGRASHAEGSNAVAYGMHSHAEGSSSTFGNVSHAEGSWTKTGHSDWSTVGTASATYGYAAHSEGSNTWAEGQNSHAEGYNTTAYGKTSHAQGSSEYNDILDRIETLEPGAPIGQQYEEKQNEIIEEWNKKFGYYKHPFSLAWGESSHVEGENCLALGAISHAEGDRNIAKGYSSHAEGYSTIASGLRSHAEGLSTIAEGNHSHAEGRYTKALSECQHVQGRYNVEDTEGKFAHIIGNGESDDARSNAFAIDWEGNIYINNSETGINLPDLLARVVVLEQKVAELGG